MKPEFQRPNLEQRYLRPVTNIIMQMCMHCGRVITKTKRAADAIHSLGKQIEYSRLRVFVTLSV